MLEIEAIGDGVAQGCPLHHLVAQPQTMKVFEQSLRSLGHLDSNEGDNLLEKVAQAPSAGIIFTGSMVLSCGKLEGKWIGCGTEINGSMDEIGYSSQLFMCI
jgi:hypothetical protein